jgi:hypothetical protein
MCGKTTTSRSGSSGRSIGSAGSVVLPDIGAFRVKSMIRW